MNPRPVLYALAAIVGATLWLSWCHDPSVRQAERLRAESAVTDAHRDTTDRRIAQLAAREVERESTLTRTARSLRDARGEIARLKAIRDSRTENDSMRPDVRDTIIAQLDIALASSDSGKAIWQALAVERGAIISRLVYERDAYRMQRDAFAKLSRPGILKKLGDALPFMAGAVVVWEALR